MQETYCYLVSRIGRPIADPQLLDVKVRLVDPHALAALRPRIAEVAQDCLSGIDVLWRELLEGQQQVW